MILSFADKDFGNLSLIEREDCWDLISFRDTQHTEITHKSIHYCTSTVPATTISMQALSVDCDL